MSVNPENNQENEAGQSTNQSWEEVGRQFQSLGESLAQAFRTAWHNEETQQRLNEMKSGLKTMIEEVGKAIEDGAQSEQGQKVISEAEKAAESLHKAGSEAVKEVQPHLLSALRSVNLELQKMIEHMETVDRN